MVINCLTQDQVAEEKKLNKSTTGILAAMQLQKNRKHVSCEIQSALKHVEKIFTAPNIPGYFNSSE
ncbi:hypothetical protein Smp_166700 [Schistosoma mansoni]|uniref:hypothetical protein n=1 Tax=Schistosoma mansoni TaxID=6183 RepID=UPI0001A623BE|nr:hypothetical protein Smp_166700 [Schistosoma mansoni]|eukprot:XP_018653662.1 hypothetical protein Smp_166700 [Schistosoma mansoni]